MLLELEELELLLQLEMKSKQQKLDAVPVVPTKHVVPVVEKTPAISPLLSKCCHHLASVDHVHAS